MTRATSHRAHTTGDTPASDSAACVEPTGDDRSSERRLFWTLCLTAGFMVAELVGGLLSGSLALIADAGHMLTDAASLGLAWLAARVSRKPADRLRSYGYHRFQVLAAFVNGIALLALVAWIAIEAARRLLSPIEVLAAPMLAVAVLGLAVNAIAFAVLHRGESHNINVRGALAHVLGDLLGSVAAIAAAAIVLTTGWVAADPLLSLVVAALILRSALRLVRQSGHILLEGTPDYLDVAKLKRELHAAVPEVEDVHHVHVWSLTEAQPLMTLHASVTDGAEHTAVLTAVKSFLASHYGIAHTTVELDYGTCADEALVTAGGAACIDDTSG